MRQQSDKRTRMKQPSDTELLNFLEEQGKGLGWVCRRSFYGRGHRLHNVTPQEAERFAGMGIKTSGTARAAITIAMREAEERRKGKAA